MPIFDSQVHAYERNHSRRPWIGILYGPAEVTGDQMVSATDAVGVDGAILVSPFSIYRYDASYALEVFAAHPNRFRLVKPVDPTDPAVSDAIADGLPPMVQRASGSFSETKSRRTQPTPPSTVCWLPRRARATGQPGVHRSSGPVGRLAARNPNTRLVIDYLGLPQPHEPPPAQPFTYLPKMLALAVHNNIAVKVSGACTLSPEAVSPLVLKPPEH
jgi:L-fuconolactonase